MRNVLYWIAMMLLVACTSPVASQQKVAMYKWLPTESAPEGYPIHLVRGVLVLPGGRLVSIPDRRNVANGWGKRGSIHIIGEEVKSLPQRLELEWFSYAEDKFYKGSFSLPSQVISELFQIGISKDRQTGRSAAFDCIIVGMAPGGLVVMWLAAGAEVVEVGSWQAEEAQLPWSSVLDNPKISRAAFIRKILNAQLGPAGLSKLERDGVSVARYSDYRAQYRWRPWVTGAGKGLDIVVQTFNGENSYFASDGAILMRERYAVPVELELRWSVNGGVALVALIHFDESEVLAAFAKLSRGDLSHQLALQLDTTSNAVVVSLRDDKFVLPLKKARIEVFRER